MTQIEGLKSQIEALAPADFIKLRKWIIEKDWKIWDEEIKHDASFGKLDFFYEEAMLAKADGQLKDL
ncbi:MAG: hypothetical protein R2880_15485 [Deinococcales bacterium]